MAVVITLPFPEPPRSVVRVLNVLQILQYGDEQEIHDAGIDGDVPRPWDPTSCPADLRDDVWAWCDEVASWINHEYAWRPAQMIPSCWPKHGHIARELPVLAILRWTADVSTGPEAVEDWHRYTYPMFCDRMFSRLGESSCRTGTHAEWPAESRWRSQRNRDRREQARESASRQSR